MRLRRRYYNWFSPWYDSFVRMHSRDRQGNMRDFLADVARIEEGQTVIDLCTGTGSGALRIARHGVHVLGVDFSEGMLRQARRKSAGLAVDWVQADACRLPLRSCCADRVTCSYAMYELAPRSRDRILREAVRVLKPQGLFVMVEHLPPARPLVKLLYWIRIRFLGGRQLKRFAGSEAQELARFFTQVGTALAATGRTKAVFGCKPDDTSAASLR
jgi:demethylphylloquinol methyltransferase